MENFKNYYKFPLHADSSGEYVRTIDEEMALIFTVRLADNVIQDIINKLNGESNKTIEWGEWHIKNGIEIWYDDTEVMKVSGWSMLHKIGYSGYGLSEEAIKIQDEFAKYVVDILNS